jgi:hypothetical protein
MKQRRSLLLRQRQRDEASRATSAPKEVHMTNAESQDTTPKDGVPNASAASKVAGAAPEGQPGKGRAPVAKTSAVPARQKQPCHTYQNWSEVGQEGGDHGGQEARTAE